MGCSTSASAIPQIRDKDYFVDQANKYFDTLQDGTFKKSKIPHYQEFIIRWEWPPWLLLSGYKSKEMSMIDAIDRVGTDCFVTEREYRYSEEQPAVRSRVKIYYGNDDFKNKKDVIPIYEEFSFDESGKMTFIEAWSLDIGDGQLGPRDAEGWPIKPYRLSTLATPLMDKKTGEIDLKAPASVAAMKNNKDVKDLLERTEHWKFSAVKEGIKFSEKVVQDDIECRNKKKGTPHHHHSGHPAVSGV